MQVTPELQAYVQDLNEQIMVTSNRAAQHAAANAGLRVQLQAASEEIASLQEQLAWYQAAETADKKAAPPSK
ncbi:hypothetical protein RCZAHN_35 [Rhodobacter phage RcZahn]|nr:hypothetical protein RCZAHN_35 [Rhodobacter phage RcZahn]